MPNAPRLTNMDPKKFRELIKRRIPYGNIAIQCDDDTTPEHLAKNGMVCAIVTWCPERAVDGEVVDEGFHEPPPDAQVHKEFTSERED